MIRIRINFSKTELLRYTSHLDLHRSWERTFRRAGLPIVYSKGFHPQPKINLASALPLGITSECEILDVWFENYVEVDTIKDLTINALPPGIEINSIVQVQENLPSLQSTLLSTVYRVKLIEEVIDLEDRILAIKNSKNIIRNRRGKTYNLRKLIEHITIEEEQNCNQIIVMQLAAREGATGRPDEVLDALAIDISLAQIHRVKLFTNDF